MGEGSAKTEKNFRQVFVLASAVATMFLLTELQMFRFKAGFFSEQVLMSQILLYFQISFLNKYSRILFFLDISKFWLYFRLKKYVQGKKKHKHFLVVFLSDTKGISQALHSHPIWNLQDRSHQLRLFLHVIIRKTLTNFI